MRDSIFMSPKCELSQAKSQVEMNANSSPTFNDVISTGDTPSLVHLISMCARLKGYTKAERALKKASDAGSIQATFALMLLYYYGLVEGAFTKTKTRWITHAKSPSSFRSGIQHTI